jgi:hypothetical protein
MNLTRTTLWASMLMGYAILAVPNDIKWAGLILFPCSIFLDYQQWKDDKLKGGEPHGSVQNMQKEDIKADQASPKIWWNGKDLHRLPQKN